MAINNKINKDCVLHKKLCQFFCTSTKCVNKILCEKCILDHLEVHPRQFIYSMENLAEIHSFDKVSKMKEMLGKQKVLNQHKIIQMYAPFASILDPLIKRTQEFHKQSKNLTVKELLTYLTKNKTIIQNTKITKSDTNTLIGKPQTMVQQTIMQVQIINQKQGQIKQLTQNFSWYSDATEQMCTSVQNQLSSMIKVAIKLLDNYFKIHASRFTQTGVGRENHHEESFFKRYVNSHEVASKGERSTIQMKLIQSKTQMLRKDQQIKRTKNEIKQKVIKIQQLSLKIQGLKEELLQWQQKLERQQKQRRQAAGRQKKKLEQFLIKNDVISNAVNVISLEKKTLQDKYLYLIPQLVPAPIELNLSQHGLTRQQLEMFAKFKTLQIFKMNFMPCDRQFLSLAFKNYQNLHTIQLNSANINDQVLQKISLSFPPRLKHLHLIDNQINDDGLQFMFRNLHSSSIVLQSLFISYNNLTSRCIQVLSKFCYDIKVLHISKNPIKSKGANLIGKYLKDLQELFVGGTGIQKQGFLAICRNCVKMKKISLVANEVTTDIVSQMLLGLHKLQWLDISYTNLSQMDLEKVEKLKIFNRGVEIVAHM